MRYIKLREEEKAYLEEHYHYGANQIERRRSQCLLLSHQGYCINELMAIFGVRYATVLDWFNNWEREGKASISIKTGRGQKRKLAGIDSTVLQDRVEKHSRDLKAVVAELKEGFHIQVSKRTVQRFLKTGRLHFSPDPPQPEAKAG